MLKKWFISAFPEIMKISQNLGPKLGQKLNKNEYLMKRCIGSAKPHRTVFSLFSKDITILKKWFISAFAESERIPQNLGPKLGQKLSKIESSMKRCIGSANPHRDRFPLFLKILRCYRSGSKAHFLKSRGSISKSGPKIRPKIVKNWIFNEKVHRIRETLPDPFFTFSQDITMLKNCFISAFPENRENISKSGPKFRPKIK